MNPPRSLASDLQQWSSEDLERLLRARPDLATPPPADVTELAERAAARSSVSLALQGLDAWTLCVARAMAAVQAGGGPARPEELAEGLGLAGEDAELLAATGRLTAVALAWGDPPALVSAACSALGPWPCGLAPASPMPLTPEAVEAGLAAVGEDGMRVLDRLLWGPPTGTVRRADRPVNPADAESTMDLLLAHGLLRPTGPDQVVLPREVALHLRAGRLVPETPPTRAPGWPAPSGTLGSGLDPALLDRAAVGSAQEFISHAEVMLDELGSRAPRPLANGGMPKRELAALARVVGERADESPSQSRFILALLRHAGLLVAQPRAWLTTTAYDDFLARTGYGRWRTLATVWAGLGWWPGHAEPRAAALRAGALAELAGAEPGTAVDEASLAERLAWRRPGLAAGARESWPAMAAELMAEARWLGLLAFDRTTGLARAVGDPSSPDPGFADFGDRLMIQSDLTAVAAAPLDNATARAMSGLADRESHGATATFRFSKASIRRGLDAGWSAEAMTGWLREHNAEGPSAPLPDPLLTLIADTARAHGAVRVVPVGAVVRVDDPALGAAILAGPGAEELGLRELAPGVIAADAEADELVGMLRAAGLAPVAERPGGERYTSLRPRRAPAPRPAPTPPPVDTARLAGVLAQRTPGSMSTDRVLAELDAAHAADSWVDVGWVDDDGVRRDHLMRVLSVSAGVADLVRRAAGRIRLPVSRIVRVDPSGDEPGSGHGTEGAEGAGN